MDLSTTIRTVPDFPKKGILFYDITTMLKDASAFSFAMDAMYRMAKTRDIDAVAGIESRGFIFGTPLALRLGKGFIPIRKPGKLPAEKHTEEYSLEYGKNVVEIHKDAISKGQRILLVDDLLATGGTMRAAANLVERSGGIVEQVIFLIELTNLNGRDLLKGYDVRSLIKCSG